MKLFISGLLNVFLLIQNISSSNLSNKNLKIQIQKSDNSDNSDFSELENKNTPKTNTIFLRELENSNSNTNLKSHIDNNFAVLSSQSRFVEVTNGNRSQSKTKTKLILPVMNIEGKHDLNYFYPYFIKNRIIASNPDETHISSTKLSSTCLDKGCELCISSNNLPCSECKKGFFLHETRCATQCPHNYVSDIFKRICTPFKIWSRYKQFVYVKAYSTGSCKNICGDVSDDCSCHPKCMRDGTCCTDYNDCEMMIADNQGREAICQKIEHCELCNFKTSSLMCAQCKPEKFFSDGKCLSSCTDTQQNILTNKICIKKENNCNHCADGIPTICSKCRNGFYLFNDQCLGSCPVGFRADRINWICLRPPIFAWYWIFPTTSGCREDCGSQMSEDQDCSCTKDCFQFGNCCQDIEDFCPEFIWWK